MEFEFGPADARDATAIALLRTTVAEQLAARHGRGHWSSAVSEPGALRAIRTSRVIVARHGGKIIATFRLATSKPWAIDPNYFTSCRRPLYLHDLAVEPSRQRQGLGSRSLEEARRIAIEWQADVIRVDAYDSPAGAGAFYASCGFREVGRVVYRGTPLIYFEMVL